MTELTGGHDVSGRMDVSVAPTADPGADLTLLVAAAAGGDEAAWTALTDRFSRLVWGVVRSYRLSPDDAADATQNTWLRLLENLERIERLVKSGHTDRLAHTAAPA